MSCFAALTRHCACCSFPADGVTWPCFGLWQLWQQSSSCQAVARGSTSSVLGASDAALGDTNPGNSLAEKGQSFALGVRSRVDGQEGLPFTGTVIYCVCLFPPARESQVLKDSLETKDCLASR